MGTKRGSGFKPAQRTSDVVVQDYNGEVLIYDLRNDKAHCLNETSSAIWRACDGAKTIEELAALYGGEELVWLALSELKNRELIENVDLNKDLSGMSRREVIRKIGLGSMVALPVIASMVAPSSVYAASCVPGGTCTCSGANGGAGNVCIPATSTCNPGCVCRWTNNGNNAGACGP
jgi:hypothetical protein